MRQVTCPEAVDLVETCMAQCRQLGYPFAGFSSDAECLCGAGLAPGVEQAPCPADCGDAAAEADVADRAIAFVLGYPDFF